MGIRSLGRLALAFATAGAVAVGSAAAEMSAVETAPFGTPSHETPSFEKPAAEAPAAPAPVAPVPTVEVVAVEASAKRCVYVSSFHAGHDWNDRVEKGLEQNPIRLDGSLRYGSSLSIRLA
jgi:hypothetical protein